MCLAGFGGISLNLYLTKKLRAQKCPEFFVFAKNLYYSHCPLRVYDRRHPQSRYVFNTPLVFMRHQCTGSELDGAGRIVSGSAANTIKEPKG